MPLLGHPCPVCKVGRYTTFEDKYVVGVTAPHAAISRKDNETLVCSKCGQIEAFCDLIKTWTPKEVFWVVLGDRKKVHTHAVVALVSEGEPDYTPTELKWGNDEEAMKVCEYFNTYMGYDRDRVLEIVNTSMRWAR